VDWGSGGRRTKTAGFVWEGSDVSRVQQCPSFEGQDHAIEDPYTGYNYNTSYLGHGPSEVNPEPALVATIRTPAGCAMFGDGEYAGGANKFMRAPFEDVAGGGDQFAFRHAGTQGFRHRGACNVAFVDGHATSLGSRFVETDSDREAIAEQTGFLSADNDLYDLH
jgi:prepilin-type processing-associated H-X9-DG protein